MYELRWLSAVEVAQGIRKGLWSCQEVLERALSLVERENAGLNAVLNVDADGAREAARSADGQIKRNEPTGPLHGVPMTIKDVFDVAGMLSTAGSKQLDGRVAQRDAEAVARLRAAGAVIFGRSNTPAFAGDAQCDSELYGRTTNPWDLTRTSGGSSGGAAAAVAAGFVSLELGSDAGGSLRIPAHFCGIAAHKPTFGLVPTGGHMPPPPGRPDFPTVLNVVGPLARSVDDLTAAMEVLTRERPARWRVHPDVRRSARRRIAWAPNFATRSDTATTEILSKTASRIADAGCVVSELELNALPIADAVRLHWQLVDVCYRSWYGAGPETTLDNVAMLVLEQEKYAAAIDAALDGVDCLMLPVTPVAAPEHCPKLSAIPVDGVPTDYWEVLVANCQPFNVTGHPVTTIPVGSTREGLPVGVQLVGRRFADFCLLATARVVEEIVQFRKHPEVVVGRRSDG
jgi:amidase